MQFTKFAGRIVFPITDLLLYSNIWIAAGALALVFQTKLILTGKPFFTSLDGFVFFGALFLYSLHRVVGIERLRDFKASGRHLIISKFKNHIIVYAAVSLLICAWFFLHLSRPLQWMAVIPGLVALAYALPVLAGRKRLRDLDFLKIFLIGPVWVWITVLLPAMESGFWPNVGVIILMTEKVFFIFAISIPFDIRDLKLDKHTRVKTLPGKIGVRNSQWLATGAGLLSLFFAGLNYRVDVYSSSVLLSILVSLAFTTILIWWSAQIQHDYFFSGLLDGSMLWQFLLVYGAH